MTLAANDLQDGDRLGRFVLLHDRDGTLHAIASGAIVAACETMDGTLILLPGGRMVQVDRSLRTVLSWLEVGAR